jgi:hypothetical protein
MSGKLWFRQAARPLVGEAEGPIIRLQHSVRQCFPVVSHSDMKEPHDIPLLTNECGCSRNIESEKCEMRIVLLVDVPTD